MNKYYSVTEITREIKNRLEDSFAGVWIAGEVSNVHKPSSGHTYLTIKDQCAQLQAVMFRGVGSRLKFELKDGLEVVAYGSISVYEPRGQYQLKIEAVEPKGVGALQLAFQQLKEKLTKEGIFNSEHKKKLPFLPQKVAIVTSPTGAAVRDMVNVINRRFENIQILLCPVKVQGDGAADEIAEAIANVNRLGDVDVMIVGRGGGSIEDLWAFNEETVARSIYHSVVPVISAVGHETDVTIADFVADKRALTPSEAGEMVVPRMDVLLDKLRVVNGRLSRSLQNTVQRARNRLQVAANSYAFRKPLDRVYNLQQRLDDILQRAEAAVKHKHEDVRSRLLHAGEKLEGLSPLGILNRGYSLTTLIGDVTPLSNADRLKKGDKIRTRLIDRNIISVVDTVKGL